MKKILLLSLLTPSICFGYYGGSNLSFSGYPSYDERSPMKPYSNDEYSQNRYKNDVERYVKDAEDYIENANNDIQKIKAAQQEAINNANRVIQEYNNYQRYNR